VKDTLPSGVVFASGPCTGTTILTCTLGTVAAGATKTVVVKVNIPHDFLSKMFVNSAIITNKATVSSTTPDPNPANNNVSLNTKVINVADLDIAGSVSPNPVHEGDIVTFTLTYHNTGPSDALQGFILYYVPAGFTLVNHTILPCAMGTGTVLCNLSPVTSAGYTQTFILQLRVASNFLNPGETSRTVSNEFRISSTTADTDPGPALFITNVVVIP
jgi:large repetitive protein